MRIGFARSRKSLLVHQKNYDQIFIHYLFTCRPYHNYYNLESKMAMGKIEDRIKKMKEAIQSEAKQRALQIVERAEE